MPKPNKSSASSGTRKKHARKAVGNEPAEDDKSKRQELKGKSKKDRKDLKNAPKQKSYVPPVKPTPVVLDPLAGMGLAKRLPGELVVLLRMLGKKSTVTREKGLDEINKSWINEDNEIVLVEMVPVWTHHYPSLITHPSRRIRHLAATVLARLLLLPNVRDLILLRLEEEDNMLGTWSLSTNDPDKLVAQTSFSTFSQYIIFLPTADHTAEQATITDSSPLLHFISRTILDPSAIWKTINPPPTSVLPPTSSKSSGSKRKPPPPPQQNERVREDEADALEEVSDRDARLRVSGLGFLCWFITSTPKISQDGNPLADLLSSPVFWTCLWSLHSKPPWTGKEHSDETLMGKDQFLVRKAGWGLVGGLTSSLTPLPNDAFSLASTAILLSAFSETDVGILGTMWSSLLPWLKAHKDAWTCQYSLESLKDDDEEEVEEEEDPDSESSTNDDGDAAKSAVAAPSSLYDTFLTFLSNTCNNAPLTCYPAVIVVLSTIPMKVMRSEGQGGLNKFLNAMWAARHRDDEGKGALDFGLLSNRQKAHHAFLSSLTECFMFLIKRICSDWDSVLDSETTLASVGGLFGNELGADADISGMLGRTVEEQTKRILLLIATKHRELGPQHSEGFLQILRGFLERLDNVNSKLFDSAWTSISSALSEPAEVGPELKATALRALISSGSEENRIRINAKALLNLVFSSAVKCLLRSDTDRAKATLSSLMGQFTAGSEIWEMVDQTDVADLDRYIVSHACQLLTDSSNPDLLLLYFEQRGSKEGWQHLLRDFVSCWRDPTSAGNKDTQKGLDRLLEFIDRGVLYQKLFKDSDDEVNVKEMEDLLSDSISNVLGVDVIATEEVAIEAGKIERMLRCRRYFASQEWFESTCWSALLSTFVGKVDDVLHSDDLWTPKEITMLHLILASLSPSNFSGSNSADMLLPLAPRTFVTAYVLPSGDANVVRISRELWGTVSGILAEGQNTDSMVSNVKDLLRQIVSDVKVCVTPDTVLSAFNRSQSLNPKSPITDLLPPKSDLDSMLDSISPHPFDPSLAVLDRGVPPLSSYSKTLHRKPAFDVRGFSQYARIISLLIEILHRDRVLTRRCLWAVKHIIALEQFIGDMLAFPSTHTARQKKADVFGDTSRRPTLEELATKARGIITFALASVDIDDWTSWTRIIINSMSQTSQGALEGPVPDSIARLVTDLLGNSMKNDSYLYCRVLRRILERIFEEIGKDGADMWLELARKVEKKASLLCITILRCLTVHAPEPSKMDRYRAELASSLLAIKPAKANTAGKTTLRLLLATAPKEDSEVVFLTQQRAINVVKAFQGWVAASGDEEDEEDEGVDEELETTMTMLFCVLAPVLQGVTGSHWEMMFDLIESNLENCGFSDDSTLETLAGTLQLIITIKDLARSNKTLKADWESRSKTVLASVRDLAMAKINPEEMSVPGSSLRKLVLAVVQGLPHDLMGKDTLPKMCHLLGDASIDVQKMSFQLLQAAARKHLEELVIEAGVDTEESVKIELPLELLAILHQSLDQEEEDTVESRQMIFGSLLGWLITFGMFHDASLKVRLGFINQLRELSLIDHHFLPPIIHLLRLDLGPVKAVKLDLWSVEDFYIEYVDLDETFTLQILAAHLYYQALLAVPSLIHNWISSCKDRQVSLAITTLTSQYFSPILVQTELASLKDPSVTAELNTGSENMKIKVIPAANEVAASYSVDEHQLEIRLKIPTDWPLHKIEVKDVSRVGVEENRWRAWIFAVQQIIWSQNGRIVDGLSLFKRNVSGHFEGQVECAICYSIISVMDGSLPKKPCRTCKNRFHSACLYKWFHTSHSSSCPLCRSDIF